MIWQKRTVKITDDGTVFLSAVNDPDNFLFFAGSINLQAHALGHKDGKPWNEAVVVSEEILLLRNSEGDWYKIVGECPEAWIMSECECIVA